MITFSPGCFRHLDEDSESAHIVVRYFACRALKIASLTYDRYCRPLWFMVMDEMDKVKTVGSCNSYAARSSNAAFFCLTLS